MRAKSSSVLVGVGDDSAKVAADMSCDCGGHAVGEDTICESFARTLLSSFSG